MAFFLEATFVGLFFFGWDRLSPRQHLVDDLAGGDRLQLLGAVDPDRQRLDAEPGRRGLQSRRPCAWRSTDFFEVLFNPVAQAKFVHTVSAGYVTASMFVLGVCAWYLLQGRHIGHRQALDDGRRQLRPRLGARRSSCSATRAATPPASTRR